MSTGIKPRSVMEPPEPTKVETNGESDAFMQTAVPLLKEYTAKLERLVNEVTSLHEMYDQRSRPDSHRDQLPVGYLKARRRMIQQNVFKLQFPVQDLDRQVSQMIEHGHLDADIHRIELKLRLNELECALQSAIELSDYPMAESE